MPKRKTTADFLLDATAVHGVRYNYSAVVYHNYRTPVDIICRVHGKFSQTPADHISSAAGCPTCAGSARVTPSQFLADARRVHGDKYDYSLVEFQTNQSPVQIICAEHGVFLQTPKQHRKGRGCPKCGGTTRLTYDEWVARSRAAHGEKYDYSCVEYTTLAAKVKIVCPEHGPFMQQAGVHMKGHECPKCAKHQTAKLLRRVPPVHALQTGFTYDLSTYANNKTPVPVTCAHNHTFMQRTGDAARYGCPTCTGRYSRGEQELREYIQSLGVRVIKSRTTIAPKEIDLWCPDHAVGFEFNGLYWHSDAYPQARERHAEKSQLTAQAGGRLVHIWEDDWRDRRSAVEALVKARLGLLPSVGARQCAVHAVSAADARAFLNTYHIQGWASAEYIGLWFEGVLVACMGLAPARSIRGGRAGVWELIRYGAACRVQGGGSRLLAAWKTQAQWDRLVTYCDLAQFDGGLYTAMGFTLTKRYAPDYKVLFAGATRRLHKSCAQKTRLRIALGDKFDPAKTEAQLCAENYIFRIWDCGKLRFELGSNQ